MNRAYIRRSLSLCIVASLGLLLFAVLPFHSRALNILTYSDTITNSRPLGFSNHTLRFILKTAIAPSGYIQIAPPSGFEVTASSTFEERNVEVYVNGIARTASSVLSSTVDQVVITRGSPGLIRYNLNSTAGIPTDANIEIRIGNITSGASMSGFSYSSSTGTTTIPKDTPPIKNSSDIGTHKVAVTIGGGAQEAYADFSIAVVNSIGTGDVNTREFVPPYRFNGAPSGTIGGTTFNAELSLETDELAACKYSNASGTSYASMTHTFSHTGQIVHSSLIAIATGTQNTYFVRCIDDEGNFNTDDFVITFLSLPPPVGTPNASGTNEGGGTGTGNSGGGTGGQSGGSTGSGGGGSNGSGGGGSGGSGGGSGGNSGPGNPSNSGGGLETVNGPYQSGDAEVIIRGYAFPGSTVYALVDGKSAVTSRASNDGAYSLTISAIARGVYTFGVYAMDTEGTKSSTFSTSFTVTGGRTSNLSNINIMPSIKVRPDPVNPGEVLNVSGQAIPNADITIENQNEKSTASRRSFTTTSGGNGKWSATIDTTGFTKGTYKIRAKAKQPAGLVLETNFSDYTFYGVGQGADVPLSADLNTDGKINLTDFSILLFWWGGNGGNSNPPADINRDGKVSLTDFSIMLFNWTG